MEQARAAFDNSLSVARWKVVRDAPDHEDGRDPLAPDWWTDDTEASQSFLRAQGVQL